MPERVIVITGGGSGIGRAAAIRFAHNGDRVIVVGRRAEPLSETASSSERIVPLVGDVCRESDVAAIIKIVAQRWGRLDCVVNNAGVFVQRSLEETDPELVTSVFATNVLAPTLVSRASLPLLKTAQGSIINISSTFGHKAAPLIAHYAASKAAVEQLTRCWALELAPLKIRVNAVAPGPTETPILQSSGLSAAEIAMIKQSESLQVPLGRRGTSDDIAAWIVNLADSSASWVTGQVLAIDGGLSIV